MKNVMLCIIVCLFFALSCPVVGGQEAQNVDAEVLAAIDIMFSEPFSDEAIEAQKLVVEFAESSDEVSLTINSIICPYIDSKYGPGILAHHIAGAVKFDLEHPELAYDGLLDIPPALTAALRVYRQIRERDPSFHDAFLDEADMREAKGELNDLIEERLGLEPQE